MNIKYNQKVFTAFTLFRKNKKITQTSTDLHTYIIVMETTITCVLLPKTSVHAFFTGHASINALFLAHCELGGGACPRPNTYSPLAYKRSLRIYSE